MPPDGHRSEGTLSLSEVPYAGAKPFGSFLAFEKGTRCKSETASGNIRSNGYTPNPDPNPDPNPAFRCSTTNATRKIKRSQPSAAPAGWRCQCWRRPGLKLYVLLIHTVASAIRDRISSAHGNDIAPARSSSNPPNSPPPAIATFQEVVSIA